MTVLLGVGELARVEWAVEKGTECGAARFVLVVAARSQGPHVAAAAAKLDRLRRIAAEAVKQCDRTVVPQILAPQSLAAALGLCDGPIFVARPGAPRLAAGGGSRRRRGRGRRPEGASTPTRNASSTRRGRSLSASVAGSCASRRRWSPPS
ncbi:MAG: RNA methyltransferase [Holophagales bacterium]|nr:RNA methyltransferase [Holophagales bacterium]